MNEELDKWLALQADIRASLTAVQRKQRKQLELLTAIAKQMEESLQVIGVAIQELKEKK